MNTPRESGVDTLTRNLAVIAANLISGHVAFLLTIPPDQVFAIWPPAGISLAAAVLHGRKVWSGIFLGLLFTQLSALISLRSVVPDGRALAMGVAIAAAATLQAIGAAWALGRLGVRAAELDEERDIYYFFLYGCLAWSLVASGVGTSLFLWGSVIQPGQLVRTFSTWWVGEALGAMLIAPLIIALAGPAHEVWKGRRRAVFGSIGVTVAAVLVLFWIASAAEGTAIAVRFRAQAASLGQRLEGIWRGYEAIVSSTASFLEAARQVDRTHFRHFASRQLKENQGLVALQWAPRIGAAERGSLEESVQREGFQQFRVREITIDGTLVPAAPRDEYFPVVFIEPTTGLERVMGLDATAEEYRRRTLERARKSGKVVASAPLGTVRSPEVQDGLALVRAVFLESAPESQAPTGSSSPLGYVLGIFRIPRMVGAALAVESWHGFRLSILDEWGERPVVYRDALDPGQFTYDEAAAAGLVYETVHSFGARQWRLIFTATRQYYRDEYTWQPYVVLTLGLAFCGCVSAFLLVLTGRTSKIELLVAERTEELRTMNLDLAREVAVRHQTEIELRQARDEALEASRVKSDFLANMSHEIRTPVNAIIGLSDLMSESPVDGEERRLSRIIRTAGGDLLQVINDILDYSKIEAGKRTLDPQPFDLGASMESIVELMQPRANERGLALVLDDADRLDGFVVGDEGVIRQVVLNLVSNGLKFTDQGSVTIRVRHSPAGGTQRLFRLEVIDTGLGIPEELQPKLFEKFFQADINPMRKVAGTGLGLAISKQLVALMGGTMGLMSSPGHGSTFSFEVKLETRERYGRAAEAMALDSPVRQHAPVLGRVLVVDDNSANQFVILQMLERLGYEADTVANGQEAVDIVDRVCYGAILMDCNMPVLDGYQATRRIRSRAQQNPKATPSTVPIVGVTAYALAGDREKCLAAGMDDYLSKPLTLERLRQMLGRRAEHLPKRPVAGAVASPGVPDEDVKGIRIHLNTLATALDNKTIRRAVELFLDDLGMRLSNLERARREGDVGATVHELHAIAGGFATLGARRISRLALELEDVARQSDPEEAHGKLEALRPQMEALRSFLKNLLPELAAD
ncbi:MAG: CHASE domain-containing protein [Candidatus Wallbacteria bacterium]|nr:CHASE domain-containing protein [Candidatus Wallbacteria bacterium]